MSAPERSPLGTPSRRRALLALLWTLLGAVAVLVLVVLPAEYGVDPTGFGRAVGLAELGGGAEGAPEPIAADESGALRSRDEAWRTESVSIEIGPREEVEFKISAVEGSAVHFAWVSGGPLYADLHAEPFNDLDSDDIRYRERDGVAAGYGSLTTPFSGWHGWYWRNDGGQAVTVELTVSGWFTKLQELHRAPARSP